MTAIGTPVSPTSIYALWNSGVEGSSEGIELRSRTRRSDRPTSARTAVELFAAGAEFHGQSVRIGSEPGR